MTETAVNQFDSGTFEMTSLLERIPSVHSMNDIPFVGEGHPESSQLHRSDSTPSVSDRLYHSYSASSLGCAEPASNHSSRLISVTDIELPKHSSLIRTDDLYALHSTCCQLKNDIESYGPASLNSIILSSVFERVNSAFIDAITALSTSCDDVNLFCGAFYPLRDIFRHMQRVGPVGSVFPKSSLLSTLIKWDYRQLINSFLTLLRTSPGFVATAYLELPANERKIFSGGNRSDVIEDVFNAQRLSPLGILFYGMHRDPNQRINYFAAMCSQLLGEGHNECLEFLFSKFSKSLFLSNPNNIKLDLLLRKFIVKGSALVPTTGNAGSSTHTSTTNATTATAISVSMNTGEDFWINFCSQMLELLGSDDFLPKELAQFVATICELSPQFAPLVRGAAIKHYKRLLKGLLSNPHAFGILNDTFISDSTQKLLILSFIQQLSDAIDRDGSFVDKICGANIALGDLEVYYEPNQLMVMSLSDLVFLYHSLLPAKKPSAAMVQDDNEWCLDNIQADLEPVMKDLSAKLPAMRSRIVREQQGIFNEYWQVFKIEQDGLVNDMDNNSWSPETFGIPGLLVPRKNMDVKSILNYSIQDAESRGNFVDVHTLSKYLHAESPLNAVVQELEKGVLVLTSHRQELHVILDAHMQHFLKLKKDQQKFFHNLSRYRLNFWYEQEVRNTAVYNRALEVAALLRGELSLQRSNSGSSISSYSRRFSARPRRLSLLSGHSLMDSFFVSKDYLIKPKLADREIDITMKYLRSEHVYENFCRSEELIHRFNCEISMLLSRLMERDFLTSTSTCYKKDARTQAQTSNHHRMSMSVLPDISGTRSRSRKSSPNLLLDIFEWKSADQTHIDSSMGLQNDDIGGTVPDKDVLCGLLLSDLGADFLSKGAESDEFMQQTGRMLVDGDGQFIQPVLEYISMQSTPRNKLKGFQTLNKVVRCKLEAESPAGVSFSRHDVTYELSKLLGREAGTLFRDLQIVSGFVPTSVLETVDEGQPFWDVADAALKILDQVVVKSMDLAARMMRYNETVKGTSVVANMGVNDAVAIWSFCARHGRPKAQRKLAELYLAYPHTLLEVMPFAKPAILFEGIEPSLVRNAVVAHWMQMAAQKGEPKAVEYCKQLQKIDFI